MVPYSLNLTTWLAIGNESFLTLSLATARDIRKTPVHTSVVLLCCGTQCSDDSAAETPVDTITCHIGRCAHPVGAVVSEPQHESPSSSRSDLNARVRSRHQPLRFVYTSLSTARRFRASMHSRCGLLVRACAIPAAYCSKHSLSRHDLRPSIACSCRLSIGRRRIKILVAPGD